MKLKKLLVTSATVLLLSSTSQAQEWNWPKEDKILFGTFTALNTVDILQTRYAFESDDYKEANPILSPLGKNGATALMLGYNIGLYFFFDKYPAYRTETLGVLSTIKLGITAHNASIGVGFEF